MICTKCKICKPETEFHWKFKHKGIKHRACKICRNGWHKGYHKKNSERIIARVSKWQQENKARKKANTNYSGATKYGYIPCTCCTKEEIKQVYMKCPKGYHVDHIITKTFGGLHCAKNMQYLTPEEHYKKTAEETKERANRNRL